MNDLTKTIEKLIDVMYKVWSLESSTKWTPQNPAKGQCGVTSLVVNDLFGGGVLKTQTVDGWHFYNRINGTRYDLTKSQFSEDIQYQDIVSSREEAFADTNENQYKYLRENVSKLLTKLCLE